MNHGTLIIDPPWPYQEAKEGGNRTGYSNYLYPPLSEEALGELPIRRLGSHLFLWTTGPFLEKSFTLIRKWGFEPITWLAWVKTSGLEVGKEEPFKPNYGVGYWFRGCVEPVIVAKLPGSHSIRTPWVGLLCNSAAHSRKPDNLYEIVETEYQGNNFPKPWIELFARRTRENWLCLGDEVDGLDIRDSINRHLEERNDLKLCA